MQTDKETILSNQERLRSQVRELRVQAQGFDSQLEAKVD